MLTVHRAERADALIGPLAELLATAPADPFAPDVIAVPSRGVERWVTQQLSLTLAPAARATASPPTSNSRARQHLSAKSWRRCRSCDRGGSVGRERLVWALLAVMDASRASRGARCWPTTSVAGSLTGRIGTGAATRPPPRSRGCSPPMARTGPR